MPTPILGQSQLSANQMAVFVQQVNPTAPDLAPFYLQIGAQYGIRGDIAFAQSLLETNYFRFTRDVRSEQNNFAGIGAIGSGTRGASFPTPEMGIEAQIQHLYAYATTAPPPANKLIVDPRFQLVVRGSAPNWEDLAGKWAADPNYGNKIMAVYQQMAQMTAVNLGLLIGYENGEYRPEQAVTRDELAVVLERLWNLL